MSQQVNGRIREITVPFINKVGMLHINMENCKWEVNAYFVLLWIPLVVCSTMYILLLVNNSVIFISFYNNNKKLLPIVVDSNVGDDDYKLVRSPDNKTAAADLGRRSLNCVRLAGGESQTNA